MVDILFASSNSGKAIEVRKICSRHGYKVHTADELISVCGPPPTVEEGIESYLTNASLKATAYFNWSGMPALGDDSGLEVEVLDNAPGISSARYAGEGTSSHDNIRKLLSNLKQATNRKAFFRAVLSFTTDGQRYIESTGILKGQIAQSPRGSGGFGYDSVFIPDGFAETLAQLKERGEFVATHRVLALEQLCLRLADAQN